MNSLYKTPSQERYLSETLYGLLAKKYMENSILKSIRIMGVKNGVAYLECEPYDDAYDVEKAQKMIYRRRNAICDKLNVYLLNVTYFSEWGVVDGMGYNLIKRDKEDN